MIIAVTIIFGQWEGSRHRSCVYAIIIYWLCHLDILKHLQNNAVGRVTCWLSYSQRHAPCSSHMLGLLWLLWDYYRRGKAEKKRTLQAIHKGGPSFWKWWWCWFHDNIWKLLELSNSRSQNYYRFLSQLQLLLCLYANIQYPSMYINFCLKDNRIFCWHWIANCWYSSRAGNDI